MFLVFHVIVILHLSFTGMQMAYPEAINFHVSSRVRYSFFSFCQNENTKLALRPGLLRRRKYKQYMGLSQNFQITTYHWPQKDS